VSTTPPKGDDKRDVVNRLLGYMVRGAGQTNFALAVSLRLVSVVALVLVPLFVGQAVNAAADSDSGELAGWSIAALIAGGVFLLLGIPAERLFAKSASSGTFRLQCDLSEHMQSLSLTFFDRQPVGELMSRVTNDLESIALFFEDAVSRLLRGVFQVAVIMVVMLIIDWRLALAVLVTVPIMLGITSAVERASTPAFASMQDKIGALSGFHEETIAGHKPIIANRRQEWASAENDGYADEVYDVGSKAQFLALLQIPITQSIIVLQMVIVVVVGSLLVIAGDSEVGVIIAFLGFAGLLSGPLSEIAQLTGLMLRAAAGGERVFAILAEEPSVVDADDAKPFAFQGGRVTFQDVDFSYVPGRPILRGNTFEAKPGEKVGIVGPTGAGKSTIINILTRYYDIQAGTIMIDGQELTTLTQESLRRQIGTVLQEAFLFSDTVMNNLKYAREGATDEECIAAAKQANAHEFILNLPQGYDTQMTERGANLSQGQRQMLTIARAMVADPQMLILDEATSNVDTRTEKLIQEGLQRLMEGKTSFVIAHRLSTVQDAARILVLNAGEIVENGPHDQLMEQKGLYYNLYMSQFRGKGPAGEDVDTSGFVST
jgi:ABC-type multidrug transport system fused ATPase/permease subunit